MQTLASALGLSTATTALLLSWFPSDGALAPPRSPTSSTWPPRSMRPRTEPITEAERRIQRYFRAYTALAKAAMIITALKLNSEDVPLADRGRDPDRLAEPDHAAAHLRQAGADGKCRRSLLRPRPVSSPPDGCARNLPGPAADFATLFTTPPEKADYLQTLSDTNQMGHRHPRSPVWRPAAEPNEAGQLALTYPADSARRPLSRGSSPAKRSSPARGSPPR